MTTNQIVRAINDHVCAGKPAYWQAGAKNKRIIRARVRAGQFQVKTFAGWCKASPADKIDLQR